MVDLVRAGPVKSFLFARRSVFSRVKISLVVLKRCVVQYKQKMHNVKHSRKTDSENYIRYNKKEVIYCAETSKGEEAKEINC